MLGFFLLSIIFFSDKVQSAVPPYTHLIQCPRQTVFSPLFNIPLIIGFLRKEGLCGLSAYLSATYPHPLVTLKPSDRCQPAG